MLRDGAGKLFAAMSDLGFGAPMQVAQLPVRVDAAALFGTELLASCAAGWPSVLSRLNRAYYDVAKLLLAGPAARLSLGAGSQVRAFLETRC